MERQKKKIAATVALYADLGLVWFVKEVTVEKLSAGAVENCYCH